MKELWNGIAQDFLAALSGTSPAASIFGGVPDGLGIFPVAGLVGPANCRAGSAVLIHENWALTASHCVASLPHRLFLFVRQPPKNKPIVVEVEKIYWLGGDSVDLPGSWPSGAEKKFGEYDEIVLLKLSEGGEKILPANFAKLAGGVQPNTGDLLLTVGYGEDEDGNFPKGAPILAIMRDFGARPNARGAGYRDPRVFLNGLSRKYDSGAPVFFPDISTPLSSLVRLIGIHSGRAPAGENAFISAADEVAEYLPVTKIVQRWIESHTIDGTEEKPNFEVKHFVLRESLNCEILSNEAGQQNNLSNITNEDVWIFTDVASSKGIVRRCNQFVINSIGSKTYVLMSRDGVDKKLELSEGRPDGKSIGIYWLEAKEDAGRGKINEYYFFLRIPVMPGNPRRIHVEVFTSDGNGVRPGSGNIRDVKQPDTGRPDGPVDELPELEISEFDAGCPALDPVVKSAAGVSDDQDDQGNGYEKRRG